MMKEDPVGSFFFVCEKLEETHNFTHFQQILTIQIVYSILARDNSLQVNTSPLMMLTNNSIPL